MRGLTLGRVMSQSKGHEWVLAPLPPAMLAAQRGAATSAVAAPKLWHRAQVEVRPCA